MVRDTQITTTKEWRMAPLFSCSLQLFLDTRQRLYRTFLFMFTHLLQPIKNHNNSATRKHSLRCYKKSQEIDTKENTELEEKKRREPFPSRLDAFRNHPLYVLQRHLKKYEILHPDAKPLGYFKEQPVYPRSAVHRVRCRCRCRRTSFSLVL
jgi:hypothetical protein